MSSINYFEFHYYGFMFHRYVPTLCKNSKDAKMLVSKMRPKTVQNFKGCKDARIQDAKIYGRKLSCLEYKLSAVESRGDTAIPFHAGFLLN